VGLRAPETKADPMITNGTDSVVKVVGVDDDPRVVSTVASIIKWGEP
jgi:hypothetical protein